ncbi:MAG: helix-turn-helix transcriptional regulator [Candidatus Saccharibacteria bacterium]|nr:helix-turn-helix transcriptional regulator [Candidatus Saccharibacteria bacterium]
MNLEKIGKFIAQKRQEKNFTQESLAEKLDVSNRSISKWERGICLPDANNMAKLCKIFDISYNELLSGEELKKTEYARKAEENLEEFARIEAEQNKKFLFYENVIGVISTAALISLCFAATLMMEMMTSFAIVLIVIGVIIMIVGGSFCLKIETEAGKYQCRHCGNLYVPKYSSVYLAPHFGRTCYMYCPKCHKKSWQKKIV